MEAGLKFWRYRNYFLLEITLRRNRKESTQNPWCFENYFRFLDSKSQVGARSVQLKNSEKEKKKRNEIKSSIFLETLLSRKYLSTLQVGVSHLCMSLKNMK